MIITKAVGTVDPVESDNPNGEFDVILSTDSLDRDGDILKADEWKTPLPEHITFDSDHGMSVATTVGSGKPFINGDGQLQVRGTFASTEHAQTVRTLVNEGHITTTSVAFMTAPSAEKDAKPSRELLNGAFVAIPSNRDSVVLSSKSLATAIVKDADPQAMMQAIHDAAVHLGADCAHAEPSESDDSADHKSSGLQTGTPHNSTAKSTDSAVDAAELPNSAADSAESADLAAEDVARANALRASAFSVETTPQENDYAE